MISRFFIDRPIFATVLSVVITLIGGIALAYLPVAQYPRITPPAVVVSISYPGANAQTVADTVAAPIEQEVNGVEGMMYMSSQMGNDGSYSLTVTFDIGTDLKTALVMVQNRVALAMPQLPTEVQNQGITIRKKTPDILMIVNFFSPDGRYDDVYLSNYATIYVRDELLRVEGVSDVNYQGQRDYSIRCWLDPQKLAASRMTALDVAQAIRQQNLDAPAGTLGQPPASAANPFQLPLVTLGRLHDPAQFGAIIVKAGPGPSAAPVVGGAQGAPVDSSLPADVVADPLRRPAGNTVVLTVPGPNPPTTGSSSGDDTTGGTSSSSGSGDTATTTPTSGGAASTGGASSGGASAAGGATTGGGAMGAGPGGLSIDQTTNSDVAVGVLSGTLAGAAPRPPAVGIIRLRDVARIELGAQNYNQACSFDGKPAVGLTVYQLPGTNALDVADRVRAKMDELKARFPDGLDYAIGYDTTPYIRESVTDVFVTLLEAVALVGLVVLFFLQDWRAMILPMIDVPVSIIGTFAVMAALTAVGDAYRIPWLNFSLNNISLFGLVLAIGIVVDDAIVVLENIERLIATGLDPRTATLKAMEEVTGPIVAVALVLCAVFVPCAFISGITGQFFRQFAVTIAVSTVISAINAVTMTPSRAVLIFRTEEGKKHELHREALPWWAFAAVGGLATVWLAQKLPPDFLGLPKPFAGEGAQATPKLLSWALVSLHFLPGALAGGVVGWFSIRPVNAALGAFFRAFNRAFDRMSHAYGWVVGQLLRVSVVVLVGYGGLLLLTGYAFHKTPTGFIPQQDQGRLIVNIQLPDSASLERTKEVAAKVEKIARETKGVNHTITISGLSFLLQANSPNFASMFIVLKPFDKRQDPSLRDTAIMARLRKAWAEQVKEAQVTVFGASPIPGLGVAGGFKLVVEDRGGLGLSALQRQTDDLIRELKQRPGLNSVSTQFRSNTPQLFLDINRTKAASLGVELQDVNQTLDMYLGSLYVNSFNEFGRHWQVTVQAEGRYRNRVRNINLFQVRNKYGQMVPLGTLVTPREVSGPISVTRYNLSTAATVSGNVQGVSTGDAIQDIDRVAARSLPLTMRTEWTELMFLQNRAGNTALYVFLLSIVSVFLALAALYESWSLPLAVILVVPLCMLCSVAGVLATNRDANIFVQIGLVVLVGLACKNAILIVEYARQLHQEGRPGAEATREASRLRLRPILMTSFAFIFGVIPLVVASGAGAEMRRSLGIAVFSGMLGVTFFGVFLTPVFFHVIQEVSETRLFAAELTRRVGSGAAGGLLGLLAGFLLGKLHPALLPWGPVVGACAGTSLALAAVEIHRRLNVRPAPLPPALPPSDPGGGPT